MTLVPAKLFVKKADPEQGQVKEAGHYKPGKKLDYFFMYPDL